MKKLSALIICLLMIVTCGLAGCATFSINKVKYYNEVLAKVGNTNITRFEVLNAYNSYGNSYFVQQQGKSESEAIESTLDLLIDRESLYQYALTEAKYKPTSSQVNSIVEEMFSSLDNQMNDYVSTAKKILNIENVEEDVEEEKSETTYKYEDYVYTPRATLEEVRTYYTNAEKTTVSSTPTEWYNITGYAIKYILPEDETYTAIINETFLADHTKDGIIEEIKTEYLKHFKQDLIDSEKIENVDAIYNKSINLLAEDLMNYEYYLRDSKGKAYSKVTNDLLYRYFERTFKSQIQSQYLENLRVYYLEHETLSVNDIMDEFDSKITSSYAQYVNRHTTYKNKMKDIGTDGDTILYHPTLNDGTKFGYFIHTLLNFSESQKTAIKNLDKEDIYYDTDYASIIAETEVSYRDENGEEAGKATLSEVVSKYQEICNISDYATRMQAFIQFMFKYTGDTATLSSGMPYVVGTNGFSSMVEAFTNESVALMEQGKGSMSQVDLSDIDTLCVTEYGIHFVFFVDEVDAYDFAYAEKDSVKIQDLTKTLNPLTGETYFDMLFDSVFPAGSSEEVYTSNNGYSDFENQIIEDVQAVNKVVKYTTKIKATTTSFK